MTGPLRCDLHCHSSHSTDSGNYALRRARLGESYTDPERLYRICRARGMDLVTITDHNTVEGALRIAHLPGTFLSVEVTTRLPERDVPLHVLVWDLTEEDHRDLQPYRGSVYELVELLHERQLHHALAHPLYRMGPPIRRSDVERLMLLFGVWEGRNGARPREQNELAVRLAAAVTPSYVTKLVERHDFQAWHTGSIALGAGSDDHGSLDLATTYTIAPGESVESFLGAVSRGAGELVGEHGSTAKLAHATAALALGAYRASGNPLPRPWGPLAASLFEEAAEETDGRHEAIAKAASLAARALGEQARSAKLDAGTLSRVPQHAGQALAAVALHAPYLGTAHHHASSRQGLAYLEEAFFGIAPAPPALRVLCFSDTYDELNGVAGTMRRLSAEGARRGELTVVTSREHAVDEPGLLAVPPEWSIPLPGYESIELRVPALLDLLARIERERPTVIHVATPGPIGLAGLLIARVLGVPVVGSYHTELAPYALHLTSDLLVSELTRVYVDWFYRQCAIVLAPTTPVAKALRDRQYPKQIRVWGRSVDVSHFRPARRSLRLRRSLLGDQGDLLLLSVGRVSPEKRLDVLLDAYGLLRQRHPGARLALAGDGPAREELEAAAPPGVRFLGAVEGDALARLYASADVFCFPSTTDTFGQVLLEAGASGLPVVATRTGGTAELVEHRRNGLLVPPDDPESFARALRRLATQAERRRELGNQGRIRAAARTSERSFGELWAAYRDAAGASTETLSDLVR